MTAYDLSTVVSCLDTISGILDVERQDIIDCLSGKVIDKETAEDLGVPNDEDEE